MATVTLGVSERARPIDGDDVVPIEEAPKVEHLIPYQLFRHRANDLLRLVRIQLSKGIVESVAVGEGIDIEEGLEVRSGRAVSQQQPNLPPGSQPAQEH